MALDNERTLTLLKTLIKLGFEINNISYNDGLVLGYGDSEDDDVIVDIEPEFIEYCVKQVVQPQGE
jgi:hypothetical protein